jgi:hypothetical protein
VGHVLAGESAGEHVDRLNVRPVDSGHVAEVGDAGVAVVEDADGGRFDLGVPGDGAAEDGADALVELTRAAEQGADARAGHADHNAC